MRSSRVVAGDRAGNLRGTGPPGPCRGGQLRHRPDAAEETVRQITGAGGKAIALKADVGSSADRRLVARTLDVFGRLDVLVNNAGITSQGRKDILEATEESWDLVFDTNLKGPFFLSQLVANEIIRQIAAGSIEEGKIVNISSVSHYAVSVNRADYCMSKAAVSMMTKLFAPPGRREDQRLRGLPRRDRERHDRPGQGKVRPADR